MIIFARMIALIACLHLCEAAAAGPAPERFRLVLYGWHGTCEVQLHPEKVAYKQTVRDGAGGFKVSRARTFTPTAKQWAAFRKTLDSLNAWQWKTEYKPPVGHTGDTMWRLQIAYADKKLTSEGDNKYPGSTGANGGYDLEPTPPFKTFLKAVQSLVGDLPVD